MCLGIRTRGKEELVSKVKPSEPQSNCQLKMDRDAARLTCPETTCISNLMSDKKTQICSNSCSGQSDLGCSVSSLLMDRLTDVFAPVLKILIAWTDQCR